MFKPLSEFDERSRKLPFLSAASHHAHRRGPALEMLDCLRYTDPSEDGRGVVAALGPKPMCSAEDASTGPNVHSRRTWRYACGVAAAHAPSSGVRVLGDAFVSRL